MHVSGLMLIHQINTDALSLSAAVKGLTNWPRSQETATSNRMKWGLVFHQVFHHVCTDVDFSFKPTAALVSL